VSGDNRAVLPDRHLDLGCGKRPRNPYERSRLSGVDIRPLESGEDFEYRAADLTVEPIPYESDRFGSVSAFDFIEHVPRVLPRGDGRSTTFPFIRLMDEIWREANELAGRAVDEARTTIALTDRPTSHPEIPRLS